MLLSMRQTPVVAINRAVALGRAVSPEAGLADLNELDAGRLADFLPFHAARADLLARAGRNAEAADALDKALALDPEAAEARYLAARRAAISD